MRGTQKDETNKWDDWLRPQYHMVIPNKMSLSATFRGSDWRGMKDVKHLVSET